MKHSEKDFILSVSESPEELTLAPPDLPELAAPALDYPALDLSPAPASRASSLTLAAGDGADPSGATLPAEPATELLDLRDCSPPRLLLRLRSALATLPPGGQLEFLANVLSGDLDLAGFASVTGARIAAGGTPGRLALHAPRQP